MPDGSSLEAADREVDGQFKDVPVGATHQGCVGQTGPTVVDPSHLDWIEFLLVDEDDQPVAGEPYQLTLPDGSVLEGQLDEQGLVRVEGIPSGDCTIYFPDLDQVLSAPSQPEVADPGEPDLET
jgi:hypothetical protein